MDGFTGQIAHLKISLFEGKIGIKNFTLQSKVQVVNNNTSLNVEAITLNFKWRQLIRRVVDVTIVLHNPQLFFVAEETSIELTEASDLKKVVSPLKTTIEKLPRFITNVDLIDGEIRYLDPTSKPAWEIAIEKLNLRIENFSNDQALSKICRIECDFRLCQGEGKLNLVLHPMAIELTLAIEVELKSINLVLMNNLFLAYGKIDINSGLLDLSGKLAIAENSIKGYLYPNLRNMDFVSKADRADPFVQKIRERIVAALFAVLIANRKNRNGVMIPIEGRLDNPELQNGVALRKILQKAIIKAYIPSFKEILNFGSISSLTRAGLKGMARRILRNR
ncbi:hypothetical protein GCM10009119_38070 [Algoriphagus jejuensis]|uniref:AsmA-like protein n=2 Tax=Algoriphagus jejuensis TaxID=419934 RepID=A0ABP3YJI2_9BACT